MFKAITQLARRNINTPWGLPITEEFKSAFYEKYILTKKYLSEKVTFSDDLLLMERITYWASEEDYISFATDDDPHISSYIEKSSLYRSSAELVENMTCYDEDGANIYTQPHIFIVFRPGCAGNFISNVLESLTNNQLNDISLSANGHAHFNATVERKKLGIDHLSMGAGLSGIDPEFFSNAEKIKYYRNKIDTTDYENKPYVTWTHNYENILLYQFAFPNSKILTITSDTFNERILSLIMAVKKNCFSGDSQLPLVPKARIKIKILKKKLISESFRKYYRDKKYVSGHDDLDLFLIIQGHLDAHKLNLNTNLDSIIPYEDDDSDKTLSDIKRKIQYSIGIGNTELATSKIKFADILGKDTKTISIALETLLGRVITDREFTYLETTLGQYIKGQDQLLLSNPIAYISMLKEKADTIVSSFENI